MKPNILENICYTELVYQRINKKLNLSLSKMEIETLVHQVIEASCSTVTKRGKNYYIKNPQKNIQITVNSNNYRVITADRI